MLNFSYDASTPSFNDTPFGILNPSVGLFNLHSKNPNNI